MTAAWICWSSGKDSAWALRELRRSGEVEVTGLVTTVTEPFCRVAMHGVRVEILRTQAERLGLPLREVPIPHPCPNEEYEAAMGRLLTEARAEGVEAMVFGDLFLEDVRAYREEMLRGSGVRPLFPLWGRDTRQLVRTMLREGLEAWITCVDPERLDPSFAGRRLDGPLIEELPAEVDPCAENGEFHSCVTDGPCFSRPIRVRPGETTQREGFVFADLRLVEPPSAASPPR